MTDTIETQSGCIALWHMHGDEITITDAAGLSRGRWPDGKQRPKLLRHLIEQGHTTPLELVQTAWLVECPIYVARQWMRHRTWVFNELSLRHCKPERCYTPVNAPHMYTEPCSAAMLTYETMLAREDLPREQARGVLPLATMTRFCASVDLHNLLRFLELRDSEHAQMETREYAQAMKRILAPMLPTVASIYGWEVES